MFFRMIHGAFARQKKKMFMIALTVALGASLATAMLNVMMDVGDKVNQELKAYGANITVVPKATSVLNDLYDMEVRAPVGAPTCWRRNSGKSKRFSGPLTSWIIPPSSIRKSRFLPGAT